MRRRHRQSKAHAALPMISGGAFALGALFFFASTAGFADGYYNLFGFFRGGAGSGPSLTTGYGYERAITINHTLVGASDSTNFPFLFAGTYDFLANVVYGGNVTNASGYDIVFTSDSAGATLLNYEIETYDPATGTVSMWVKLPTLSHTTDTTIYVWYGNGSIATSQQNVMGTWDSNFVGVWHLADFASNRNVVDSTGTSNGTHNKQTIQASVPGLWGRALSYNGAGDYTTLGSSSTYGFTNNFTVEAWANATTLSGSPYEAVLTDVDSTASGAGYGLANQYGQWAWYADQNYLDSGGAAGAWDYLVGTISGGTRQAYVNATASGTDTANPGTSTQNLVLGSFYANLPSGDGYNYGGLIQEVRISNIARSADWITATYNSASSPSAFYSVGTATAIGASGTNWVTGESLGGTRNDYTGWIGCEVTMRTDVTVTALGRMVASGNSQNHAVKLVTASNGTDLAGGSVTVNTSSGTAGQFTYANLAAPLTLTAGKAYYVLSQETNGGDLWYNFTTTIATNPVAYAQGAFYGSSGTYTYAGGSATNCYGPVDFKYTGGTDYKLTLGEALGTSRSNYSGWVGAELTIGPVPIVVTALGRWVSVGNSGTHALKITQVSGDTDIATGTLATAGGPVGMFRYVSLATPVTLSAGTSYYLVSQETSGGDTWYDNNTELTSVLPDATVLLGVYSPDSTTWTDAGSQNYVYGPVNLVYHF